MNLNEKTQDRLFETNILGKLTDLFNLKKTEMRIYNLLRSKKQPMLVTEICKSLDISRRMIQDYVKNLTEKGFLKRKIIQNKRLSYVYIAQPPIIVWNKIKTRLKNMLKEGNNFFK